MSHSQRRFPNAFAEKGHCFLGGRDPPEVEEPLPGLVVVPGEEPLPAMVVVPGPCSPSRLDSFVMPVTGVTTITPSSPPASTAPAVPVGNNSIDTIAADAANLADAAHTAHAALIQSAFPPKLVATSSLGPIMPIAIPVPGLEPGNGTSLIAPLLSLTVGITSTPVVERQKPATKMTASKTSTTPRNLCASEWVVKHHGMHDAFNAYWAGIGDTAEHKHFIMASEAAKEAKAKAAV